MYLTDKADPELLAYIKDRLNKINLDVILDTGYLIPFLEGKPFSIFSDIGTTERPDFVCSKLSEGRIVLLVDGSPFAIFLPFFFLIIFKILTIIRLNLFTYHFYVSLNILPLSSLPYYLGSMLHLEIIIPNYCLKSYSTELLLQSKQLLFL